MNIRKNFELYIVFFNIGLVSFGGGLAMLPIMTEMLVNKRHWVEKEELVNYFALTQTLPGIIAANVATMVGHRVNKIGGALFGMLGMITPSIIVITLIATFLINFQDNIIVINALRGINLAVIALLLNLIFSMRKNVFDGITLLIAVTTFILVALFKINPPYIILTAGLLGYLVYRGKSS
jgi:chromate transporter